jgi:hypothetical protein
VDEVAALLEHAVEHAFRARHLPQHVHVQAALVAARLVGDARLGDAAFDRVL